MKSIFLALTFFVSIFVSAQVNSYSDIAPGYTKEKDRKKIFSKMDELINRVSFEIECKKENISYMVVDYYDITKQQYNMPKTVIVKACGKNRTYINSSKGGFDYWLSGTWVLNSVSDPK